jgi:hypothetical protein
MEHNMMPNEETLKKMFGDFSDEAPEALYRLVATGFVKAVSPKAIQVLLKESAFKDFLIKYEQIGELVVGFVLAMVFELIPLEDWDDERKRFAYNLRVRSYEEIGEFGWSLINTDALPRFQSFWEDETQKARQTIRLAQANRIKDIMKEVVEEEVQRAIYSSKTSSIEKEIEPAMASGQMNVKPATQDSPNAHELEGKKRKQK